MFAAVRASCLLYACAANSLDFMSQEMGGDDIRGLANENVGIAGADMNGDGRIDLAFACGDLNGDGNSDIVEATFLRSADVPQRVHFLDSSGRITSSVTLCEVAGRTASVGSMFNDSSLPDIALGTYEGEVLLFANLGIDHMTGDHLGFEQRNTLSTGSGGSVRAIYVGPLHEGSVVVACAVTSRPNRVFYTTSVKTAAAPEQQRNIAIKGLVAFLVFVLLVVFLLVVACVVARRPNRVLYTTSVETVAAPEQQLIVA